MPRFALVGVGVCLPVTGFTAGIHSYRGVAVADQS